MNERHVAAIGPGGFVISRVNFTVIVVALPIVFLFQWCLERWLMRRTILRQEAEGFYQLLVARKEAAG